VKSGNYHKTKRWKRFFKTLGWMGITAGLGVGIYYLVVGLRYWTDNSSVFQTAHVEISGLSILSEEDIRTLISLPPHKKIFDISFSALKKSVESSPYVANASFGRKFPNTVRIDIVERVPFAFIVFDKVMLVDKEGYLLPKLLGKPMLEDLPVITGISVENPKDGVKLTDDRITRAAAILSLAHTHLPELEKSISEIHFNADGELAVFLSGSGVQIEFGDIDYRQKLEKLKYFLEFCDMHSISNTFEYINLNYRDQVVIKNKI
jgi:cell division protein FtsQ